MLEALIHDHPSDLEELILELPWIQDARGPLELVSAGEGAEVYLVADGVKRLASPDWIRTNGLDRSTVAHVSADVIAGYPSGANLY
jgi:hypothetical protein